MLFAAIMERLRHILHEKVGIDQRVQYMIEVLFAIRKENFKVITDMSILHGFPSFLSAYGHSCESSTSGFIFLSAWSGRGW